MRLRNVIPMACVLLALLAGCVGDGPRSGCAKRPMAVMFLLDGLRADALANACTPNIDRLAAGTWRPGYRGEWTLSGQTLADARPSSAANHAAILTGCDATRTKVFANGQIKAGAYGDCPLWLARVVDADPSRRALFAYSWGEDGDFGKHPRVAFRHASDADNGREVPKLLGAPDAPDATAWFIDLPDHGGHGTGFYPHGGDYLAAVHESDRLIGASLDAIAARPTFAAEDWLVLVVSDHGGYGRGHGMWGGQASTVPLVAAGRGVPSGRLAGAPRHYALTALALKHFGLDAAKLGLDARLARLAESEMARPLADGLAAYLDFEKGAPANAVAAGPEPVLLGTNAVSGAKGGLFGGCLRLNGPGNAVAGVRLDGSEKLKFEGGSCFAVTLWAKLPAAQRGDAPLVANKDWRSGANPGIVLVSARKTENVSVPGVGFNGAVADARRRIDLGTFDVEPGKWTFYAATRDADGVLTVYQGASDGRLHWICERAEGLVLDALPFHVGQDGTGGYRHSLVGEVDECALWTRALDGDEVRLVFEAGRTGVPLGTLLANPAAGL